MANSLYNAVSIIDQHGGEAYRITKFVDGNVESSYITNRYDCNCPAGVRPTCRHRKMLPVLLNMNLVNTPYFFDYDLGIGCDFNGNLRPFEHLIDPAAAPAFQPNPEPATQTSPAKSWRRM